MKKYVLCVLVIGLGIYFAGCGKKQESLEDMQAPMSLESLGTTSMETKAQPEAKVAPVAAVAPATTEAAPKLESLPPQGPYKPSAQEIQTALKNAGYYTGNVDGKIGPMTKKAIEEFQKANGLGADGKVGPKTWVALGKYLAAAPAEQVGKVKK